jgi:hypothetical protein
VDLHSAVVLVPFARLRTSFPKAFSAQVDWIRLSLVGLVGRNCDLVTVGGPDPLQMPSAFALLPIELTQIVRTPRVQTAS